MEIDPPSFNAGRRRKFDEFAQDEQVEVNRVHRPVYARLPVPTERGVSRFAVPDDSPIQTEPSHQPNRQRSLTLGKVVETVAVGTLIIAVMSAHTCRSLIRRATRAGRRTYADRDNIRSYNTAKRRLITITRKLSNITQYRRRPLSSSSSPFSSSSSSSKSHRSPRHSSGDIKSTNGQENLPGAVDDCWLDRSQLLKVESESPIAADRNDGDQDEFDGYESDELDFTAQDERDEDHETLLDPLEVDQMCAGPLSYTFESRAPIPVCEELEKIHSGYTKSIYDTTESSSKSLMNQIEPVVSGKGSILEDADVVPDDEVSKSNGNGLSQAGSVSSSRKKGPTSRRIQPSRKSNVRSPEMAQGLTSSSKTVELSTRRGSLRLKKKEELAAIERAEKSRK